jgi:DUF4097 and DUF4098 domain-containing protein YvlB
MSRTLPIRLLALAAVVCAAPVAAQQAIDQTIPTGRTGLVEIHNTAGSVRVQAWDRNQIQVQGRLGEGAERVEIGTSGDHTEIRVILPRRGGNVRGTTLVVRVPATKNVTVRTTSADVQIENVTGRVQGQSTSGDVTVSGNPSSVEGRSTSGDVRITVGNTTQVRGQSTSGDVTVRGTVRESVNVESVSGDVDVSGNTPEVRAKTVSGDLALRGVTGRVSVNTVSGDASVRESRIQFASMESVSGNIRYEGEFPRGGAFNLTSHSGDVELRLPGNVGAEFDVRSFSGRITNQLGPEAERTSRYGPGQELRFTAGAGGGMVSIKTFSGNVRIVRR